MREPTFQEMEGIAALPEFVSFLYLKDVFLPGLVQKELKKQNQAKLQSDVLHHAYMIRAYSSVIDELNSYITKIQEAVKEQQQGEIL